MTSPDNARWVQCWRGRQTDFHQTVVNPLLQQFWAGLQLAPGSRVLVPLCGKSLDMLWLAIQGHQVIGVELSPVAVRAFFKENRLTPTRRRIGPFMLWEQGSVSILCGDFFKLAPGDLGPVDAVYDRAALTALPEEVRSRYVAHLGQLLPPACKVFLLTTEDVEEGEPASEALGIAQEVTALYGVRFDVELVHGEARDVAWSDQGRDKVYRLLPRAPAGVPPCPQGGQPEPVSQ